MHKIKEAEPDKVYDVLIDVRSDISLRINPGGGERKALQMRGKDSYCD